MMKKIALTLAVAGSLAAPVGCTQTETAVGGAVAGGLVGGAIDGTSGALVGAGVGAVAGALLNRQGNGQCLYADGKGGTYTARCPR